MLANACLFFALQSFYVQSLYVLCKFASLKDLKTVTVKKFSSNAR